VLTQKHLKTVAPTKRKIEAVDEADTSETPSKKKKKKKDKVKEEPSEVFIFR